MGIDERHKVSVPLPIIFPSNIKLKPINNERHSLILVLKHPRHVNFNGNIVEHTRIRRLSKNCSEEAGKPIYSPHFCGCSRLVVFLPNQTWGAGGYASEYLLRVIIKRELNAEFFNRRHTDDEIYQFSTETIVDMTTVYKLFDEITPMIPIHT